MKFHFTELISIVRLKIYLGKILIKILIFIKIDLNKIKWVNYSRDNSVISIKALIKIDVCDLDVELWNSL